MSCSFAVMIQCSHVLSLFKHVFRPRLVDSIILSSIYCRVIPLWLATISIYLLFSLAIHFSFIRSWFCYFIVSSFQAFPPLSLLISCFYPLFYTFFHRFFYVLRISLFFYFIQWLFAFVCSYILFVHHIIRRTSIHLMCSEDVPVSFVRCLLLCHPLLTAYDLFRSSLP